MRLGPRSVFSSTDRTSEFNNIYIFFREHRLGCRLRVVSNFGDGGIDSGASRKYPHARSCEETLGSNFRARALVFCRNRLN